MSETATPKTQAHFTQALLQHLETCSQCQASKRVPEIPKCSEGRYLIKQTLIERHGGAA